MAYCTKCGAEMPQGAGFCPQCGAAAQPPEQAEKKKTPVPQKKLLPVLLAVVLVIGGILLFNSRHCAYSGCSNIRAENSTYCFNHKCAFSDCRNARGAGSKYCSLHESLVEAAENSGSSAAKDLSISNVKLKHNSSYTVVTGSVKNTGSTTYKFVKVKGAFKNSRGTTLDTDWTYAVGSEGLAPGESTTFRMSVSKDTSITKCTVTVLDD